MSKKNLRRVTWLVNAQTEWHVKKLARMEHTTPGHIVDKLVRDRMVMLHGSHIQSVRRISAGEAEPPEKEN